VTDGAQHARPGAAGLWATVRVALLTALAYACFGWASLKLHEPLGLAAPLYPAAGIALACALAFGRNALPGVWLGAWLVNAVQAAHIGQPAAAIAVAPVLIGAGAALQAAVGAWLVRRHVAQPLVLNAPADILKFGLLGALAACVISPAVAMLALKATSGVGPEGVMTMALTWWVGDSLGVLIGAPVVLSFIGQPREDWRSRRLTLGLPLLVAMVLVGSGMLEFARLDEQRLSAAFQRDADRLASDARIRLAQPLYALQALHGSTRGRAQAEREPVVEAARWWLAQPIELQAMGQSVRVPLLELPAFEARARAQGEPGFKVFDRDGGAARAVDGETLVLRFIEPAEGNTGALGVNVWSIPAARAAALATRDTGQPVATAGFRLTQSKKDETGVVLYQALYRGEPTNLAERRAQFRGVVFVTARLERMLEGLSRQATGYLRWCLVDVDEKAPRRRLAGSAGCDQQTPAATDFSAAPLLEIGGRTAELRISAPRSGVPGRQREASWLLAMAGLAAASLLGALLLTVTGHSRRTEVAVKLSTIQLRNEMDEHAQAQAALRESEARLRSILDNVPLGVMFLDAQGYVLESNPRVREMLGHNAQDMRERPVIDLVSPAEATRLLAMRRTLLSTDANTLVERLRLVNNQGQDRVLRITVSTLRNPQGRVQRLVCVLEDVTEDLRLEDSERARHRAEAASRAKSEFVSRMSHELRTPLNAMIGFAQLLGLDRSAALNESQRDWVQQIQRAGWHLLEMINETLELARIESGNIELKLAPVALEPLITACCALVTSAAAERQISLMHNVDEDAGAVLADATRLKQVLTNLMSNAVKYNRDGGDISITTRRVPPGIEEMAHDGVEQVEIVVSDTGLGMTAEQLSALFQPYNRLGREASGIEGTGIGLVISRSLTELMGGTLRASSDTGVGSIFTLRLPAAPNTEAPALRYSDTRPAPYLERRVHYVEDNETNIEVMRGIFMQRPQVLLETTLLGLDGLAAIRQTQPDLILLDMQLPDISGVELLRHLKNDDAVARIPVIVVSADATPENMQAALVAGAVHYVTKPVDLAQFLVLVDGVLDKQNSQW
jgi:PAS domain S-box-containing protein